jgi:pimeloyl-ACP methyl ester carboxylesterase
VSRRALVIGGLGVAAAAGTAAVAAVAMAGRRWAATPDATGGRPLGLPDVEESTLRTEDGAELAVAVAGAHTGGPTVVLVHCWTGDQRVWAPVARRLADDHRVVLYDHRGHGRSTVGGAGLTLEALADDLRAVLDHLDVRDAVVAGHSMGGMTAQVFAIRHPEVLRERVAGLVLVATACEGIRSPAGLTIGPSTIGHPVTGMLMGRPGTGRVLVRSTVGQAACAAHLDAVLETFLATAPSVRVSFLQAMLAMDLTGGLPGVDLPVEVVCGTRDLITPPARSRRMAELLPRARLEMIPGAGHMLPFEAPDRLAAIIRGVAAPAPEPAARSPRPSRPLPASSSPASRAPAG